jgi:two-component system, LytTR family, sensor kinase
MPHGTNERRFRSSMYAVAGVAGVLTVLEVTQTYVHLSAAGEAITPGAAALLAGPIWLLWAALAPVVFLVSSHLPLEAGVRGRSLLLHLLVALSLSTLHTLLYVPLMMLSGMPEQWGVGFGAATRKYLLVRTHLNLLGYAAIAGVYYGMELRRRARSRELLAAELQTSLTRAKLDALRMQLNPHFLFNAMHVVSTLILRGENTAANRVLGRLAELLRASLDGAESHEVVLRRELEWLERYLEIERVRFSDRLSIQIHVPESLLDATVPFLVLQPLVENAMRHGIGSRVEGGCVRVEARCRDETLELEVWNDGPGLPPGHVEGVGLTNTRARLAQLYGETGSLTLRSAPQGGVSAVVSLPYRPAAPTAGSMPEWTRQPALGHR